LIDERTWVVTTQLANSDDFFKRVEAELGFDGNESLDGSIGDGGKSQKTAIKISADAKASLASALNDPNNASAKSKCTNFSSLTGNSTNCSVNRKQFVIAHKSCTLALTTEKKHLAPLKQENKEMIWRLQELESMFAASSHVSKPSRTPPFPAPCQSIRIAGNLTVDTVGGNNSGSTKDDVGVNCTIKFVCVDDSGADGTLGAEHKDNSKSKYHDNHDIHLHPTTNAPVTSTPHNPSKTSPPATGAGGRHALDGDN
jgi:hypothetical protein